jgi:5-formyltetrahydrofolate cyclo-ligase
MAESKHEIRKKILEQRDALDYEDVEQKSKKIIEVLKEDPDYKKAKAIMFYISKDKEVDTQELLKEAIKKKTIIVPKVTNRGLICCKIIDLKNMNYSCFGTLEPKEEITCDVTKIDLIIVPGIAFDTLGNRIGYGKGYYDNLLKTAKCKKIGLAYSFQVVKKVPVDSWDVKIDKLITDQQSYNFYK